MIDGDVKTNLLNSRPVHQLSKQSWDQKRDVGVEFVVDSVTVRKVHLVADVIEGMAVAQRHWHQRRLLFHKLMPPQRLQHVRLQLLIAAVVAADAIDAVVLPQNYLSRVYPHQSLPRKRLVEAEVGGCYNCSAKVHSVQNEPPGQVVVAVAMMPFANQKLHLSVGVCRYFAVEIHYCLLPKRR